MSEIRVIKDLFSKFDLIRVPDYQRAYSWEEPQIEQFLLDIKEYIDKDINYYIGHFLFEKNKDNNKTGYVIDGQQRLTTINIFLASVFEKIKELNNGKLNPEELNIYENILCKNGKPKFATVDYDNHFFKSRVINRDKGAIKPETHSQKRILEAIEYFDKELKEESIENLRKMLKIIINASCTLNEIESQSEAVQIFIYQNDRGKDPTHLEIIKSLFMYNIYDCSDNPDNDVEYIKESFETIYKNISYIEKLVNENNVLSITLKTYYKDLNKSGINDIRKELHNYNLTNVEKLEFIKSFTKELEDNFNYLKCFWDDREKDYIRSIITLGITLDFYPFIVGIYKFKLNSEDKKALIEGLENLLIRIKLIGTRAFITDRIQDKYIEFTEKNGDITEIIKRIDMLKTTENWWWGYWNNDRLKESIIWANDNMKKFILWKYENSFDTGSYIPYDSKKMHLEHIAPRTEPANKPHGFDDYNDEEFIKLIYSLGNCILLSEKLNESVSNGPFANKYEIYINLNQQREIREMVSKNIHWGKKEIEERNKKFIDFVMEHYK